MKMRVGFIVSLAVMALVAAGCAAHSGISLEEYKAMVAARSGDALVGNKTCWACHANESHASLSGASVNCEDCHGPGELAVKDLHEEKGRMACNYKTFIPIGELSKPAQSGICLGCHAENASFNLHNWNAGAHNLNGVSCIDCHNIHSGSNLRPAKADIDELCYTCHTDVRAEFSMPNHHPVPEGKLSCMDCHEPHGTGMNKSLMKKQTVKDTCTSCHAEKEGPYVFEHSDLMEDCTICHTPHGTPNEWLLAQRQPFLCKQCHPDHRVSPASFVRFMANCTDCHSQIHGTDLPSLIIDDNNLTR